MKIMGSAGLEQKHGSKIVLHVSPHNIVTIYEADIAVEGSHALTHNCSIGTCVEQRVGVNVLHNFMAESPNVIQLFYGSVLVYYT